MDHFDLLVDCFFRRGPSKTDSKGRHCHFNDSNNGANSTPIAVVIIVGASIAMASIVEERGNKYIGQWR